MNDFWFKSDLFRVEPGEDEETNPQCYGKSLSSWLKHKLVLNGYQVEDVIPEDWGWCVMCQRQPYSLWVGCGSSVGPGEAERATPKIENIFWHCFVVAEVPLLKKIFKRPHTAEGVSKLTAELKSILISEPRITLVEESCVP